MSKLDDLRLIYASYPWVEELIMTLEAQNADFTDQNTTLRDELEDVLEEYEEVDNLLALSHRQLTTVRAEYEILNTRHMQLLDMFEAVMKQVNAKL